ncbi:MAG: dephospho-CoA kinase, partial [Gammaproteobacteria bacterium]|nr:dephospho-CoA kinase [Gammaproteobacteria bacterium]
AVEPSVAIARATARDGASAEAIQKRIDAQLSNQERIKRADVVILNDGSEQALRDKVETAWRRLND